DKGNIIEERGDNADGSFRYKYSFKYDDNNRTAEKTDYSNSSQPGSVIMYEYDNSGNKVSENYYAPPKTLYYKYTNTYDASGNLLTSNYFIENFDQPRSSDRYKYDAKNNWAEQTYSSSNGSFPTTRVITYFSDSTEKQDYNVAIDPALLSSRTEPFTILDYYIFLPGNSEAKKEIAKREAGETYTDTDGRPTEIVKKNVKGGYFEISQYYNFSKRQTQYVYWNLSDKRKLIGVNEIVYPFLNSIGYTDKISFYIFDQGQLKPADVGELNSISITDKRMDLIKKIIGDDQTRASHELHLLLQLPETGKDIGLKVIDLEESMLNNEPFAKEAVFKWNEGKFER
ncbi:MAG: hypothetical protein RIA63_09315, partial [Cyclobacteriaceae bacterium]